MLVEDDEEIQAVMQRVCANLRYGSISATNGQDGLELARLYRPNLILADSFLPTLDGREMCRLLKEDPLFGDTKMVVMTGLWADAPAVLFERKLIVAMRDTASAANPPPSAVTRPLIALLENDEAIQLLVKTIVTPLGYGFIASGNSEEAGAVVREYVPDLILADAWTPNLDGREVCRQLKEEPALAQVKTVVMTGRYADRTYRHEAL